MMKENVRFKQLQLNYLNNQRQDKEHVRLVISSLRVGAVSSVLERWTVVLLVSF